MARDYICLYHSYLDAIQALGDAERGRLLTAMLEYSITGEAPQLNGNERFLFPMIKAQIDRDLSRYDAICQKNSDNVRKRSYTNGNKGEGKGKGEGEDKGEGKGKGEIESPSGNRERFAPPTVADVAAYCQERGNTVDPQRFVDFYASKGWKVGSQQMKDWKAAVRTWERREQPQGQRRKSFAEIAEELDKEGL